MQGQSASKPTEGWQVNNFDLIRLLAALQVAIIHASGALKLTGFLAHSLVGALGRFPGVPIFFVTSGFLISKSYENCHSLSEYCRNRCLRIFPALWVCLVVTVGVMLVAGVNAIGMISTRNWLLWWAAQMTFPQYYTPEFQWPPGGLINRSLWTIPVELEFYALVPALYTLFKLHQRRGNIPLVLLLAASVALYLYLQHVLQLPSSSAFFRYLNVTVAPYLWMFLTGVLIQRNWNTLAPMLTERAHRWLLGYLLLCLAAKPLGLSLGGNLSPPIAFFPLAGLVISAATSAPGLADRLLRHQDISYGLYIYHLLVVNLVVRFGVVGTVFSIVYAIGISLLAATASWFLVEKPFLRHKHKALRSPEPPLLASVRT
jgi:peptidoglycan/LPS O-acetylase OafA/YrhL